MDDDGIVEDVIEDGGDMMGGLAKPNFLVTSFNLGITQPKFQNRIFSSFHLFHGIF